MDDVTQDSPARLVKIFYVREIVISTRLQQEVVSQMQSDLELQLETTSTLKRTYSSTSRLFIEYYNGSLQQVY